MTHRASPLKKPFVDDLAYIVHAGCFDLHCCAGIGQSLDDWKVVTCESSITVLRGTEQHNVSSIMLSYIVRAPPRLCVKVAS